LEEETNS
jgi:hypothetical protein